MAFQEEHPIVFLLLKVQRDICATLNVWQICLCFCDMSLQKGSDINHNLIGAG